MTNLSQGDFDKLRRLRDAVELAQARYDLAVMGIYAENRIDPRTARLVVGDIGASFVKTGEGSPNGNSAAAPSAANVASGDAPRRGRGRPKKTAETAPVQEAPASEPAAEEPTPASPAPGSPAAETAAG